MDKQWHCGDAKECLLYVSDLLFSKGLIQPWAFPDTITKLLVACSACRQKHPGCRGWVLQFRGDTAVEFMVTELAQHPLRIKLEGSFDLRRDPVSNGEEFSAKPFNSCVAAIVLEDPETDTLIARHRVDLASRKAVREPVWHMQLGGLSPGHEKWRYEWLTLPRWPTLPIDFMMLMELALFNFAHDAWIELSGTSPWSNWVKRSETLALTHFKEHFDLYWNQRNAHDSWLSFQSVEYWNPRSSFSG